MESIASPPEIKEEDDKRNVEILPDIEASCRAKPHITLDINCGDQDVQSPPALDENNNCLDGGDVENTNDVWESVQSNADPALVHVIQPQNTPNENPNPLTVTRAVIVTPQNANILQVPSTITCNNVIEVNGEDDDKCLVRILARNDAIEDTIVIDDSDDEAKVVIDDKSIIDLDAIDLDSTSTDTQKGKNQPNLLSSNIGANLINSLMNDPSISAVLDPYICKYCKRSFLSDDKLKVHIGLEHRDALQICDICKKAFTSKPFLELHMDTKHKFAKPKTKSVPLVCYICDESYQSGKEFTKHMEEHCVQVVVPGMDDEDDESTNETNTAETDKESDNVFPHDLTCSMCERKFANNYHLKAHYIYKHSNYRPYQCEVCRMGFMDTARLKTHYIVKHNYGKMTTGSSKIHIKQEIKQEKDIVIFKSASNSQHNVCVKCKSTFDHRILYLVHMEAEHGVKIKPKEENIKDGKILDRPSQRKVVQESFRPDSHMRLKFKWCVICGSKFPSNTQLLKHKKTAHKGQNSFPCSRCNKRFPNVASLEQHIKLHCSGETLCCSFCDKTFKTRVILQKHMRQHIGWEYKCSLCKQEFSGGTALKNHYINWHSDFMPFSCAFCQNKFSTKVACRNHIKQKHIDINSDGSLDKSLFDVVSTLIEPVLAKRKIVCHCGEKFDHSILQAVHAEMKHGTKITREHKSSQRIRNKHSNKQMSVETEASSSGEESPDESFAQENLSPLAEVRVVTPDTGMIFPEGQMTTPEPPTIRSEPPRITPVPPIISPEPRRITPEQQRINQATPRISPEPRVITPEPRIITLDPRMLNPEPQIRSSEPSPTRTYSGNMTAEMQHEPRVPPITEQPSTIVQSLPMVKSQHVRVIPIGSVLKRPLITRLRKDDSDTKRKVVSVKNLSNLTVLSGRQFRGDPCMSPSNAVGGALSLSQQDQIQHPSKTTVTADIVEQTINLL